MSLLHAVGGAIEDKLYVEDVFSTYLYTGDGSTQTINNGIDLAGVGGMVWSKDRGAGVGFHVVTDTVRGVNSQLYTHLTNAANNQTNVVTSFNTNGYTIGSNGTVNVGTIPYVSWTFRKAPKFFDIVTWTGNGAAGRQIPHNLGCEVGMIIVKRTNDAENWSVWHNSFSIYDNLFLNSTSAKVNHNSRWTALPTSTTFTVGTNTDQNANGSTYIAYLYAHDPSADGMIQCGSFTTTDGIGSANIGFEPQYIMVKGATITGDWEIYDNMRGVTISNTSGTYINTAQRLKANLANTEDTFNLGVGINQTGFNYNNGSASNTYIYMAIRRPMKVPTSGTEVYNAIARTGTGAVATVTGVGFAPDLVSIKSRSDTYGTGFFDRLRGGFSLESQVTTAEEAYAFVLNQDGITLPLTAKWNNGTSGRTYINHFFKRAPKFMDIVCYTGTGVARTVNHNLGVVPELMIVKKRNVSYDWCVFCNMTSSAFKVGIFNSSDTLSNYGYGIHLSSQPNDSLLNFTSTSSVNLSGDTYVVYLFSSLLGVSKVGSYTGNGSTQTINCGFTTGARFILIKRTDSTGDWYIWNTTRGIVAANDPHLSLNTTSAEVTTDDSIDPAVEGFICNQNTATNINVNGGSYIFLAIA